MKDAHTDGGIKSGRGSKGAEPLYPEAVGR